MAGPTALAMAVSRRPSMTHAPQSLYSTLRHLRRVRHGHLDVVVRQPCNHLGWEGCSDAGHDFWEAHLDVRDEGNDIVLVGQVDVRASTLTLGDLDAKKEDGKGQRIPVSER